LLKDFDISAIIDLDRARDAIGKLLNLIEGLQRENQELKRLNQLLLDELRRLNGEQGKPDIKPSRKDTDNKNG
jgi:hypothetical protein